MPNAAPPPKPTPQSAVCPQLAFEQLVDEAFAVREKARRLTDVVMLGFTLAAKELEKEQQKQPARQAG